MICLWLIANLLSLVKIEIFLRLLFPMSGFETIKFFLITFLSWSISFVIFPFGFKDFCLVPLLALFVPLHPELIFQRLYSELSNLLLLNVELLFEDLMDLAESNYCYFDFYFFFELEFCFDSLRPNCWFMTCWSSRNFLLFERSMSLDLFDSMDWIHVSSFLFKSPGFFS